MFETKCTDCKKVTAVPFEPTKGKPVYCKACLSKHRTRRPARASQPITFNMNNAWATRRNKSKKKIVKSVFQQ